MNLVTTDNATISLTTCLVGLLLIAPRTQLRATVQYVVMTFRRPPNDERPEPPAKERHPEITVSQPASPRDPQLHAVGSSTP